MRECECLRACVFVRGFYRLMHVHVFGFVYAKGMVDMFANGKKGTKLSVVRARVIYL